MRPKSILSILLFTPLAFSQPPVEVAIQTDVGIIELEIATRQAPVTAANFLKYVEAGAYTCASFRRTVRPDNQPNNDVKIQVIQAGPAPGTTAFPAIPLERTSVTGLSHRDGTLSMARDGPDSATSDFFLCIDDQPSSILEASAIPTVRASPLSEEC